MKPRMKFAYIVLIISVFTSCRCVDKNNIYNEISKGTKLSKELLRNADQIVRADSGIIVVYNYSKNAEYYDPHLLFFNQNLDLISAAYFASEKIESIKNGQITAYLNENRESRLDAYINEVPKLYSINYISKRDNGSGKMENKIVENIIINDDLSLSLAVRASEDKYSFPSQPAHNNLDLVKDFPLKDTLTFQLIELNFDYKSQKISSRTIQKRGKTWDHMVVLQKELIDHFYDKLFEKINTLHNTTYSK